MATDCALFDTVLEQLRKVHASEIALLHSRIKLLDKSSGGYVPEDEDSSGCCLSEDGKGLHQNHVTESYQPKCGNHKLSDDLFLHMTWESDVVPGERETCVLDDIANKALPQNGIGLDISDQDTAASLLQNGIDCRNAEQQAVFPRNGIGCKSAEQRDIDTSVKADVQTPRRILEQSWPLSSQPLSLGSHKHGLHSREAPSSRGFTYSASQKSAGTHSRVTNLLEKARPTLHHFLGPAPIPLKQISNEPTCCEKLRWKVGNSMLDPWLELVFGVIILTNAIVLAAEAQYSGIQVGYDLDYPGSSSPAAQAWPGAKEVFNLLEILYGSIYTLECGLKIFALTDRYFCDFWNYIDMATVVCFLVERLLVDILPFSSAFIRTLRLARVARLVRFVRIIEGFDALFLMITAIKGSIVVLFWALMLLFIIQLAIAILFSQILQTYFLEQDKPLDIKQDVYEYFGTFTRSILSIFELTFANWPVICRLLSENVSEWFALVVLIHKLTIGFAVIGVINGVFMQETFKVASSDNTIMVRTKEKASKAHLKKMTEFFSSLDHSQDGRVSVDEFEAIADDVEVKLWLASMDLDAADLTHLFYLLDADRDGYITLEELTTGVSKLRGTARSIDTISLLHLQRELLDATRNLLDVQEQIQEVQHHTKHVVEKLHDKDHGPLPRLTLEMNSGPLKLTENDQSIGRLQGCNRLA